MLQVYWVYDIEPKANIESRENQLNTNAQERRISN